MSTYTVHQLGTDGPQYAMAMLLHCLHAHEPFVTYGAIKAKLQLQLNVECIFPTHIGHVAGSLMNRILEIDEQAPLINMLITQPSGIPGTGVGSYLAKRYKNKMFLDWKSVSLEKKRYVVDRERKKIFAYPKWDTISQKLFGRRAIDEFSTLTFVEKDPIGGIAHGGEAESEEHKRLKHWVAKNPRALGLSKSFGNGSIEHRLLSGDEVDVLFSNGLSFRTVEVKSCKSNDVDLRRGIYQCVKYREVKSAEHKPYQSDVQSILVVERDLNKELAYRAKLLGVSWICVSVNK
jgi:hypothetical protein